MYRNIAALTLVLLVSQRFGVAASPFDDAVAKWHFGAAAQPGLTVHGNVKMGVELAGEDRTASLDRGGDGKVAQFDGGYLEIGGPAFDPPGAAFTLVLRVRDPHGAWNAPLLGSYGGDGAASLYLRGVDGTTLPREDRNFTGGKMFTPAMWMFGYADGPRAVHGSRGVVEFMWGAKQLPTPFEKMRMLPRKGDDSESAPLAVDAKNGVMRVMFPVQPLGPTDWHDVIVRGTGPKLQLFVDGVLLDEEFPLGTTRPATAPRLIGAAQLADGRLLAGFRGAIDHAALWHRALSDTEMVALSGGPKLVEQRELAVLGPPAQTMQYFRARGHNSKVGDCIPFFHDGTFHLFYLILRRNMHSKWDGGHGGLEIHQASTRDLVHWEHHPVVAPISQQWEAWNGTGGVVHHNGKFWMFYPTPDYYSEHGGIQLVTSTDGVHFTKQEPHPYLPGGDCEVFRDAQGQFNLIKTGPEQSAQAKPIADKTLVAWVQLADLDQQGGSALTIEHPDHETFDGLVFGELSSRRWMPGSNRHQRTPRTQQAWPAENAADKQMVQMALVCAGRHGTLYRNGQVYAQFDVKEPATYPAGASLIIGWRHTNGGPADRSYLRGRVFDARLYDKALSADQIALLQAHTPSEPAPVAWYDFGTGTLHDRAGKLADGQLYGKARLEGGALVLQGEGDYFKSSGTMYTQVRLTSPDLEHWTDTGTTFISSDKRLATCPNVFQIGKWHYYVCGSGLWRSAEPLGPWTEHAPLRLDNLAVPKVAAFGKNRHLYAGFLGDGGWGGNIVLREIVQADDGRLGVRFVPELIPTAGQPIPLRLPGGEAGVRLESSERASVDLPALPADYRLTMEIAPRPGVRRFGLVPRAGVAKSASDCVLAFSPSTRLVQFSSMTDSGGGAGGGPAAESVEGLDRPFEIDLIVRHDIIDVQIGEFRALTTRYWNPLGDRLRLFVEGGAVEMRSIKVRPLVEHYEPYPGWREARKNADPLALNFHLMHPGGPSAPGDPNAAFCLDGVYHLHYILAHPWNNQRSFSFVHVTSPDLLHWTWQPTKLQPSFTGHGMFSGTGFLTKEGKPAVIYHGQASRRNQIAIARDNQLSAWNKPYPVTVVDADRHEVKMNHWDPDCFLIGDTYYAISGGQNPPLLKSKDLKTWTYVGPFLKKDLPDVAVGEDISCGNFFKLGDQWMLLCISHPLGCRYYLGDWDAKAEQFVPRKHGRMNWRRDDQALGEPWRDFFAPESVLTADGRRVMWAWCATLHEAINGKTLQSLPRELNLPADGVLRIRPLRELETLRYNPATLRNLTVTDRAKPDSRVPLMASQRLLSLPGDAAEVRITIARDQAERKLFGFTLFADGKGNGLPLVIRPDIGTIRLGATEAPFAVADLPPGEDLVLDLFIDKYLVEVFANDRQALLAAHLEYVGRQHFDAGSFGAPTKIKQIDVWQISPTNEGYLDAQRNRVWEPNRH